MEKPVAGASSSRPHSEISTFSPPLLGDATDEITPAHPPREESKAEPLPKKKDSQGYQLKDSYRFLTPQEWALIAHGIGGIMDHEGHAPNHPTCWYWGPKGMPEGLYKDVVYQRAKYSYLYHTLSILRWLGMILQMLIGATLMALGAMALEHSTPITILAAANTLNAGLLGLLHNSGLPDRYRSDQHVFAEVEDFLKAVLATGLVQEGTSAAYVLAECFERYQAAKKVVQSNLPDTYMPNFDQTENKSEEGTANGTKSDTVH